jgi:hypothetical protein
MDGNGKTKMDQGHFWIRKLHADPCDDQEQTQKSVYKMPKSNPNRVQVKFFFSHFIIEVSIGFECS